MCAHQWQPALLLVKQPLTALLERFKTQIDATKTQYTGAKHAELLGHGPK